MPSISVITAVYNRAGVIAEAMQSVAVQTHPETEHIIQDGGSTDGTLDIVERHRTANTHLESSPDGGIYDAINKGIARATGDVVGLMHSDDFFADERVLARVVDALSDARIDGVYGDLDYVSASDPARIIRRWRSGTYARKKLAKGWMPPHPTLYLRREVFERHGLYDTSFRIAADYDAMLRYLAKGRIELAYIPDVLVKMRVGGESNQSLRKIIRKSREDYRAIRRNEVGGLPTLAMKNLSKLQQFF
ncbi:PGL/p-HBAD biosynthesis glycosyltransferase/MT3031 [Roseivivax jejudonensis]|uniref:PGL/p-HBAD biosynthesis glycosyltransferase/MT3031 n=1 Tax=Roseivivax jejudonensis TaxID=1529041 RepID=A0A1X6Y6B9_9RHOB|nr:glycosyltransferase family 2 protein [Roseivivax jejudonensis]SLN11677.1 PGL/p-HBAD biosynthesis glycosyltransferase/MT3031 [Roseivivax jejudonensis]